MEHVSIVPLLFMIALLLKALYINNLVVIYLSKIALLSASIAIFLRMLVLFSYLLLCHVSFKLRVLTSTYFINRHSIIGGCTPYELLYSMSPVGHLHTLGYTCFILLSPGQCNKLSPKASKYVFHDYSFEHTSYHCHDPIVGYVFLNILPSLGVFYYIPLHLRIYLQWIFHLLHHPLPLFPLLILPTFLLHHRMSLLLLIWLKLMGTFLLFLMSLLLFLLLQTIILHVRSSISIHNIQSSFHLP